MIIDSNKCFSKHICKTLSELETFKYLSKHVSRITLRKFEKGLVLREKKGYKIIYYRKKFIIYLSPYSFYSWVSKGTVLNGYQEDYRANYYANIYNGIINSILNIFSVFTDDMIYGEILEYKGKGHKQIHLQFKKVREQTKALDYDVYRSNFIKTIEETPEGRMNKDFGGILNFLKKQQSKENKKKDREFNYYIARFRRSMFSGFKGMFTANELKRIICGDTRIMSDYSWKEFLNTVEEPVIFDSQYNTKKFYFYTKQHYLLCKELLDKEVKKQKRQHEKLYKELKDEFEKGKVSKLQIKEPDWYE